MPHSWIRLSTQTSRKIDRCKGTNKADFETCLRQVISEVGDVTVERVLFEQNGKYAHVLIEWEDPVKKAHVIYDTEAFGVIDLLDAQGMDDLAAERDAG
jgi:aminoglycoside phosphotransferase family enzyme